jgi:type II secretory pathway pseudopilin PulG
MKRQRGIAMVLVLMITGILSLLILQVSLTAREHVARAQLLSDRVDLALAGQSREAAMYFTLLTQTWIENPQAGNPYAAAWNFHGRPFVVDGVTYQLQDVSGLLPLPLDSPRRFVALLTQIGVESGRAARLGDELMALQGISPGLPRPGPREAARTDAASPTAPTAADARFPLQSIRELRWLPDMDAELLARLEPLVTLYPTPGFNPLTAPRELLPLRLSPSETEGLLQLREAGAVSDTALWKLAGIAADDLTTLYPGPAIRVDTLIEHRDVAVRRQSTVILRPYSNEPFAVWSQQETSGAGP